MMRKRNIAVLLLMALLLTGLTGCAQRGDTSGVEIVAGTSERFSDEDIRDEQLHYRFKYVQSEE